MGPLTRENLDRLWAEWRTHVFGSGFDDDAQKQHAALLAAERSIVDREAQARAIRWADQTQGNSGWSVQHGYQIQLFDLAAGVEKGQLEVPR